MNRLNKTVPRQSDPFRSVGRKLVRESAAERPEFLTPSRPDPSRPADESSGRLIASGRVTLRRIVIPLSLCLIVSIAIRVTDADRRISALCFKPETRAFIGFYDATIRGISDSGRIPAVVVGVGGLVLALLGWRFRRFRAWRFSGIFLALVLVVGPGLIVNYVLKPYFGRPRPSELVEFGGSLPYAPLGRVHDAQRGYSFPSGHAAMGFYLLTPAFLRYRRRGPRVAWIAAGLLSGGIVGWTRIAIGAHFFGDVLWSAAVVYFTATVFSPMLRLDDDTSITSAEETVSLPFGDENALPEERRLAA
jgi:membrane-associated PAP2 superfamily phosphatase